MKMLITHFCPNVFNKPFYHCTVFVILYEYTHITHEVHKQNEKLAAEENIMERRRKNEKEKEENIFFIEKKTDRKNVFQ